MKYYTQCLVQNMLTGEKSVQWVPSEMAIVGNKLFPNGGGQYHIHDTFGRMPTYFVEYNRASQKFMRNECQSFNINQHECDKRLGVR